MRKTKNAKHKFLAKIQKKPENNKEKEKVMWEKLDALNKNSRTLKSTREQERKKCPLQLFNQHWICSRTNNDVYLFLLALDKPGIKKLLFSTSVQIQQ